MNTVQSTINGRYVVLHILGKGAQGTVYAVEDTLAPGRPTALKTFNTTISGGFSLGEFKRLSALNHPHLVRVYDLGLITETTGKDSPQVGGVFFSQELVAGKSAEKFAADIGENNRAEQVARIGVAVARALGLLHARGVLHGDVKPANILVMNDGSAKLIDLGLSRMIEARDGRRSGTLDYMAPEMLSGFPDERSDLFSLGVSLAQMLVGRRPRIGQPIADVCPVSVPSKLWNLVEGMTARAPDQRIQSARETVLALGRAMGSEILGKERPYELIDASSESESADTRAAKVRSAELIGRGTDLAKIEKWLGTALGKKTNSQPLVIVGAIGVGKTRLFRDAVLAVQLRTAQKGDEPPTLLSGTLVEVMSAIVADKDLESDSCLGHWLGQGIVSDEVQMGEGGNSDSLVKEMASAILGNSRPMVLLIEDADELIGQKLIVWLKEELGNISGNAIAVAVEMSDRDGARDIAGQTGSMLVELHSWEIEDEAKMVFHALGQEPDSDFMERLHALTGGVPLLTEAALAALLNARAAGNTLVEDHLQTLDLSGAPSELVLAGLLAGIGDTARKIVETLALIDGTATVEEVLEAAGIDDRNAGFEAVRLLNLRGRLRRDVGDRLHLPGFVARSLVESLEPARLKSLSLGVLSLLERRNVVVPARLVTHAVRAGRKQSAREYARRAADSLRNAGDLRAAAQQLEVLLALSKEKEVDTIRNELARVCRQTGRYQRVIELVDEITTSNGELSPQIALEKAAALRLTGDVEQALGVLDGLKDSSVVELALEARVIAARIELDRGEVEAAGEYLDGIHPGNEIEMVRSGALATAGLVALHRGDLETAQELFNSGFDSSRKNKDLRNQARFHGLKGMVSHARGDWDSASTNYCLALELADRAGDHHGAATYGVNLAMAYGELDQIPKALSAYRDGLTRLRRIGRLEEQVQAGANYAGLLLRLGDIEGAEQASLSALNRADKKRSWRSTALALCVHGDVLIALGRTVEAGKILVEAERLASSVGATAELVAARQHLATLELIQGDVEKATCWAGAASDAGADQGRTTACEQQRLSLELAIAAKGDPKVELDKLMDVLPRNPKEQRADHLYAFVTAARAARQLENTEQAVVAARAALDIEKGIRTITPSLHRQSRTQLVHEMEEIVSMDLRLTGASTAAHENWQQLARINTRLNSELRVGRLLELVMDAAIDITSAQRGFLLIVDKDDELRVRCARNIDRESLGSDERSYSRSVALRAFETGEAVITTDAQEDERFQDMHSVVDLDLRYVAAVPLKVRGRTTGTIYLDSKRGGQFSGERLSVLEALADQAAIALTNARLAAEVRKHGRQISSLNRQLSAKLESSKGELEQVKGELERRTDELIGRYKYKEIVARSEEMNAVFKLLDKVTGSDLPVVIEGESGTGKELIARAVHFNSPRRREAFVAENCAAIPETLLESVLFGHVKGAFTGAVRDSRGLFVEADKGTLFLDEVSQMPFSMQTKLLRVLQDGEVRPVGGNQTMRVNVRIVVASNSDLSAMVKKKKFREDLYYRLNVVAVRLPPLRKRKEDIALLVEHFANKHGGSNPPQISKGALEALIDYSWPGNIRQLENEMMRAIVLGDGKVDIDNLSEEIIEGVSRASESISDLDMNRQVDRLKRRMVALALKRTNGNQTNAAALLGVSRYGLQKMLSRFAGE